MPLLAGRCYFRISLNIFRLHSLISYLRPRLFSYASKAMSALNLGPRLYLDAREQKLRLLLLDTCHSINISRDVEDSIVLRWAGGWVRDKLLGNESHDIDVAVNAMTGVAFAERLLDFCSRPDIRVKHRLGTEDIGGLHNVARNPGKSKHLETAMVKVMGLDVDFVNLRRETYTEDSRNPSVEFGTACEDAMRRDATINALFYNLETGIVEDFIGGLNDLDNHLIRTPLDPLQTFADDPLRVLRLVRFASRLQFSINPETQQAIRNKKVLRALKLKVSRERVGIELKKMLRGAHPITALELLDNLDLYHTIFTSVTPLTSRNPDTSRWQVAYRCLDNILCDNKPCNLGTQLVPSREAAYIAWIIAVVSPWMLLRDSLTEEKLRKTLPPVAIMAREAFCAPKHLTSLISACYRNCEEILKLKAAVSKRTPHSNQRDTLGMAIRRWDKESKPWSLQVLCALLVDAMSQLHAWDPSDSSECLSILRSWSDFMHHLDQHGLLNAPEIKPILNGRILANSLNVKPGIWTAKALEICMAWQLCNPNESSAQGAIQEVRRRWNELKIPLPES